MKPQLRKRLRHLLLASLLLTLALGLVGGGGTAQGAPAGGGGDLAPQIADSTVFNLHLDLPEDSRIDYLRLFYYDTSPVDAAAWVTIYDGAGTYSDIIYVGSSGTAGYGTSLSAYSGHVVDNLNNAYVLNWRANTKGANMRLCGLRVAYRKSDGAGGFSSTFDYVFAAGSTLTPRDSLYRWSPTPDGGCTYVAALTYLPFLKK